MPKLGEAHSNHADQWFEIRQTAGEDDPQRAAFVDAIVKKLKRPSIEHPNTNGRDSQSCCHTSSGR